MPKAKTPGERRKELQTELAQLELYRATAAAAVLARPEVQTALDDLRALHDPTEGNVAAQPGQIAVNQEIGYVLTVCDNVLASLGRCAAALDAVVNPAPDAPEPETAAVPVPQA